MTNTPIQPGTPTADIFARITQATGIDRFHVMSPDTRRRTSYARFHAIAALRVANPHWSLSDLAAEVGRRDHGTAIHGMRRFDDLCETDSEFRRQAQEIGTPSTAASNGFAITSTTL